MRICRIAGVAAREASCLQRVPQALVDRDAENERVHADNGQRIDSVWRQVILIEKAPRLDVRNALARNLARRSGVLAIKYRVCRQRSLNRVVLAICERTTLLEMSAQIRDVEELDGQELNERPNSAARPADRRFMKGDFLAVRKTR